MQRSYTRTADRRAHTHEQHRNTRPMGRGRPNRRRDGEQIHHSRFIARAQDVVPEAPFVPRFQYSDMPFQPELARGIAAKGYVAPTPIQDAVIPHIVRGKDVVGIANTGTGKTAAFLIPLIQKVSMRRGEQVLIITPTRELALQIDEEFRSLSRSMRLSSVVCVGGVNINPQLRALRGQIDMVIGTPGRLKDLIDRTALHVEDMRTIVLDEADRMLDMGFINDMRYVMGRMPRERQTLFFSATMSSDIKQVIGEFLHEPTFVSVKTRDTSTNVDQDVRHIRPDETKVDVLHSLLSDPAFEKVIVFGRTKHGVEKLARMLARRGVEAESIHGNKDHRQRVHALDAFKEGRARVLVATDVAARGLDIPQVSHVINYDVPTTYDDYVHRIGRTGRADKKGAALTFIGEGKRMPSTEQAAHDTVAPKRMSHPAAHAPRGRFNRSWARA